MAKVLEDLSNAGVAIWLDDLSRERLVSGSLKQLIKEFNVVGVTTNPSIFNSAISTSQLYKSDILQHKSDSIEEIITKLTTDDVRDACDLFRDAYDTNNQDGRVSIEVDPRFANDTKATIEQGIQLWNLIDRPNLFIKVPATLSGLPAITQLTAEGISVNVTLIFSVKRYQQVLAAYADGLEMRIAANKNISEIHSVASFFISRIDSAVDALLDKNSELRGAVAIANAILAYDAFLKFELSDRWKNLKIKGSNLQRPLWASTGVKDPKYDPTRYVMQLVAKQIVNTMPENTLNAVKANGIFLGDSITPNIGNAKQIMEKLALAGIDIDKITNELELDGVEKFEKSWIELMNSVNKIVMSEQ
jgi:transaldolase